MRAEELMIGDWVECVDSSHEKKVYAQIDAIEEGKTCILVRQDNCNWFLNISFIKPISLTPKILVKNGWVRTKYAYGRDCMEIHGADELPEGVDNALSMARWSIDKNYQYHFLDLCMWKGSVMQHNVHYVHQLQHAFRIFGIEKEIIL